MGSNLVIAAIPDENDRVWKISSEKIPHLTLLFLGDVNAVSNLDQIMLFVEHAASTTLKRFYLPVDRRGKLGDDDADVLFFKKSRYDYKAIHDFRASLLKDQNIKTAYDSAKQFDGPWQPHLTLGYPTAPAKPLDDNESFGFFDVQFNKIAVWTGDFEGPDFLLKDYGDDWDEMDPPIPMDVAMSDILEHHGIKGMKWGVRRAASAVGRGAKKVGRGLAALGASLRDSSWQHSTYSDLKHEAVHNHVAKELDNHIERLQRSPKYRGKDLKADSDLRKTYYQDVAKTSSSAYRRAVKETYGENYTGTKSAHYVTDARGPRIEVRDKATQKTVSEAPLSSMRDIQRRRQERDADLNRAMGHSAVVDAPDITIELKVDANDQISGVGFVQPTNSEEDLAQTADLGAEFLSHYGIKGMQWGVRREGAVTTRAHIDSGILRRQTKIEAKGGEAHPPSNDAIKAEVNKRKLKKSGTASLSNQELRELQTRLQLETQVTMLTTKKGQKLVRQQLEEEGKQQLRRGVGRGIGTGVKAATPHVVRKARRGAATVAVSALL